MGCNGLHDLFLGCMQENVIITVFNQRGQKERHAASVLETSNFSSAMSFPIMYSILFIGARTWKHNGDGQIL